jgi:hypothetical protein
MDSEKHSVSRKKPLGLEGKIFSKLLLLEEVDKGNKNSRRFYKAKCDCGEEGIYDVYDIVKGIKTQCNTCSNASRTKHKHSDYIGKKFGKWTVNNHPPVPDGNRWKWKVTCDCGNVNNVSSQSLINKSSESCHECTTLGSRKFIHSDYIGKKYGHLTVLDEPEYHVKEDNGKNRRMWLVKCDCKNNTEFYIRTNDLIQNKTLGCRHCAATRREEAETENLKKDLIGIKFNMLKVLDYEKSDLKHPGSKETSRYWKVQCDCGNLISLKTDEILGTKGRILQNGDKPLKYSCGCVPHPNLPHGKVGELNCNYTGYKEVTGSYMNSIESGARYRSKNGRYIEFNITAKDVWDQFEKQDFKCYYSGIPISFDYKSASVDRVNSDKGYTVDNIVLCHKHVNLMKQTTSIDGFKIWANRIANNNYRSKTGVFIYITEGVKTQGIIEAIEKILKLDNYIHITFVNNNLEKVFEHLDKINVEHELATLSIGEFDAKVNRQFKSILDKAISSSRKAYLLYNDKFLDNRLSSVEQILNNYELDWSMKFRIKDGIK